MVTELRLLEEDKPQRAASNRPMRIFTHPRLARRRTYRSNTGTCLAITSAMLCVGSSNGANALNDLAE